MWSFDAVMDWIKKRTHIIDHPRFLEAGAIARDLYDWGLLYAGEHETDGELPMVAVLSTPWGAGGKANIRPASKLVEVGLWERTDIGFRSLKWAEQGNLTKAEIVDSRAFDRERKARQRKRVRPTTCPTGTPTGTPVEVPTSTSLSPSGYGSPAQIASPASGPPDWFAGACDAVAMTLGGSVDDRSARWAEYVASRSRKGWSMDHTDAVGWLSTVIRSERSKASSRPVGGGGAKHVQSAENRCWIVPEDMP